MCTETFQKVFLFPQETSLLTIAYELGWQTFNQKNFSGTKMTICSLRYLAKLLEIQAVIIRYLPGHITMIDLKIF